LKRRYGTSVCQFLFATVLAATASAEVALDPIFTDEIVLQRDVPAAIYGTASPGEVVQVSIAGQLKAAVADTEGSWIVHTDPTPVGGPFTMVVSGTSGNQTIGGVFFGEVWLCAGQSNMLRGFVNPNEFELNPEIYWFRPETMDFFSQPGEVCWAIAKGLYEAIEVPVMVINIARGGSKIRQWLPPHVVPNSNPRVDAILGSYLEWGRWAPDVSNAAPYTVKGCAWWQGESDRKAPEDHETLLQALIESWRTEWNDPDLPFVIMQLPSGKGLAEKGRLRNPPSNPNRGHRSAIMRNAFFQVQRKLPNVSMVVNGDLRGGIHPPANNRPIYGQRMVNAALANVYGFPVTWSGPLYDSMTAEGTSLRLHFREASGLQAYKGPNGRLQGFAMSEDGQHWVWADSATIDGEDVVLSSDELTAPTHVRYGWGKRFTYANLFNGETLPASPFHATLGD
jgi:sialate O-acetylesterase